MVETSDNTAIPLIVVSGLSGSGKSVALRTLEDLGYYCADNLPAELLPDFVATVTSGSGSYHRLAVGIDVRNRSEDLGHLPASLAAVGELGVAYSLVFLDTRDEVLIKRFSETRRRHPLSVRGLPLADAIAQERSLLKPLVSLADRVIDSSELNVHQLRRLIVTEFGLDASPGLSLLFESFAYRRGVPADADFVFDVRCLPNPHWEPTLRPLSGKDSAIRGWFEAQPLALRYLEQTRNFLEEWLPRFDADQRSYVTVAFGCTGGRHRSVWITEALADHFRGSGRESVLRFHRELE